MPIPEAKTPPSGAKCDEKYDEKYDENAKEDYAGLIAAHRAECLQTTLDGVYRRMQNAFNETPQAKAWLRERHGLRPEGLGVGYCTAGLGTQLDADQQDLLMELGVLSPERKPALADCVVFALRDLAGEVKSLVGRHIGTDAEFISRGTDEGLFAFHDDGFARGPGSDSVYLTASILDALLLHQAGAPSVLALKGLSGWTQLHGQWLRNKSIREVFILLGGGRAEREAASRLGRRLKQEGLAAHVLEIPEGLEASAWLRGDGEPRALRAVEALPGHPKAPGSSAPSLGSLTGRWEGGDFIVKGARRLYSIKGLSASGLDRMRVTIKCTLAGRPNAFFIDSLDLYVARARAAFVEGLTRELGGEQEEAHRELGALITLLEAERLRLKDGGPEAQKPLMHEGEKALALKSLQSPHLVRELLKDFEALGMIGEEKAKLLGYIGATSRLLDLPLGMLIVSRSGAGKTALQDAICSLVPEESLIKYTRLTGQALFYKEQDGLKHKVLAIEEEEGMAQALYSIRTLASSQRLCVAATRSDPKTGKLKTEEYTVEGPVFIIIATTNPDALDAETRSRFIILTIDESSEQTRRIMEIRKAQYTLEGRIRAEGRRDLIARHRNMQRLLRPVLVVNNYAPHLEYPFDQLQMRREFGKYMSLINAIALLHQHQRPLKTHGEGARSVEYIEVTAEDIALANELVLAFFPNSIDEMAPHTRRLAGEVGRFVEARGGDAVFTRKELRDFCGWGDWSVRQGLEQLCTLGYVAKLAGQNGVTFRYELLIDARHENRRNMLLTSAGELKERLETQRQKDEERKLAGRGPGKGR